LPKTYFPQFKSTAYWQGLKAHRTGAASSITRPSKRQKRNPMTSFYFSHFIFLRTLAILLAWEIVSKQKWKSWYTQK
jgi:hypothetical protein